MRDQSVDCADGLFLRRRVEDGAKWSARPPDTQNTRNALQSQQSEPNEPAIAQRRTCRRRNGVPRCDQRASLHFHTQTDDNHAELGSARQENRESVSPRSEIKNLRVQRQPSGLRAAPTYRTSRCSALVAWFRCASLWMAATRPPDRSTLKCR